MRATGKHEMQLLEFTAEARECRLKAKLLGEPESELLLKIADAFDEIASRTEARQAIEATRCW
jgi:hypothetical protein